MSVTDLCVDLEDKPVWLAADSSVFSVSFAYRSEVDCLGPFLFSSELVWNKFGSIFLLVSMEK